MSYPEQYQSALLGMTSQDFDVLDMLNQSDDDYADKHLDDSLLHPDTTQARVFVATWLATHEGNDISAFSVLIK